MLSSLRLTLLFPLASLLACGASPPSTNTITIPSTYNFSGDWGTHTTSNSNTTLITGFTGALSASAGVVSGELTPYPAPLTPCITPTTTPIPVSGTVSADGNLALTLPIAGGTATLSATLGANLNTLVSGTYQVVGGNCAMPATPLLIAEYAPLSGTYTGPLSVLNSFGLPTQGTATTITAVLTQSTTPNGSAQYPVTGNVTATGACSVSFSLSNATVTGGVLITVDPSYTLSGGFDPTGSVAAVAVFTDSVTGTNCPNAGQYFDGTLTRQ